MKKICVVGLGSIAKRHIKNLKAIYSDVQIDILRHGEGSPTEDEYGRTVFSYDDLQEKYDAVFITNPTTMHMDTLKMMTERSDAFFIEKPLRPMKHKSALTEISDESAGADEYADVTEVLPEGKTYYVACPMRYTQIVKYIKEHTDWSSVRAIRAITSSFLPDWRPGTDYAKCYSARRDLGGGVASDLIHEWDYITYLIGRPSKVHTVERRLSDLDIDVEDIAVYIGEYENKIVEVHLDYFGKSERRELELFTADDTVICDFIANKITYLKSGQVIEFDEERDDYQTAELMHFFDIASGKTKNDSDARDAEKLLRLLENG